MDSIILRGLLEFFIRERVLIIGTKGNHHYLDLMGI